MSEFSSSHAESLPNSGVQNDLSPKSGRFVLRFKTLESGPQLISTEFSLGNEVFRTSPTTLGKSRSLDAFVQLVLGTKIDPDFMLYGTSGSALRDACRIDRPAPSWALHMFGSHVEPILRRIVGIKRTGGQTIASLDRNALLNLSVEFLLDGRDITSESDVIKSLLQGIQRIVHVDSKVLMPAKTIDGTHLSRQRIESRLTEIARRIEEHYGECDETPESAPVIVQVLFGAVFIYPMLLTKFSVEFPTFVGAIRAKSYRENGVRNDVKISNPMFDCELKNRRILLIDNIVESGQTLAALEKWFEEREVADVRTFALLDKPTKRTFDIKVDWVGFQLEPDQWVAGLGLDDNNLFRHLSNVVVVSEPKPKAMSRRQ